MSDEQMMIVEEVGEVREKVESARRAGMTIGCVPTMGALHAGHISLVDAARGETDFVVVTVFVNPTQFGPSEDFDRYPRTLDADLRVLRDYDVDIVYAPDTDEIYPAGFSTYVLPQKACRSPSAPQPANRPSTSTDPCDGVTNTSIREQPPMKHASNTIASVTPKG